MLGVFLLPAFTRLGHECQDLFEPGRWNAFVHRLDLGLYSHPTEFWGNGVRTHVNSKGKIPSTGKKKSPQITIEPTTLHQAGQQTQHANNELFRLKKWESRRCFARRPALGGGGGGGRSLVGLVGLVNVCCDCSKFDLQVLRVTARMTV